MKVSWHAWAGLQPASERSLVVVSLAGTPPARSKIAHLRIAGQAADQCAWCCMPLPGLRFCAGTFLVECKETSQVLQAATPDSLVILDELGRGTATFDGFAIAHAVLDHVTAAVDCRLLFATHYHALTAEFSHRSDRVGVYHMECATHGAHPGQGTRDRAAGHPSAGAADGCAEGHEDSSPDPGAQLLFLYKLKAGPCPKSYGLQVAGMAGIPQCVVQRASVAASCMEEQLKDRFAAARSCPELPSPSLARLKQLWQMGTAGHPPHDALLATWKALQAEQ